MIKTDRLAILLATYNGEKYLSELLDSILSQTYTDWELYAHDDGSNDGTVAILKAYNERYPDKIIILDGPPTGGAKYNFMYLMREVESPYFMSCDQDDVWLPHKVETSYKEIKRLEAEYGADKPLLAFSDLTVVDCELNVIAERMSEYQNIDYSKIDFNHLMVTNNITGCVMVGNRTLCSMAAGALRLKSIIMHDYWCALIAAEFGVIYIIDEPLILYRQHGDNAVGARNLHGVGYISESIKRLREIKEIFEIKRRQVAYFAEFFNLPASHIASQYANLREHGKLRRIYFHIKNHVLMNGFARNIGLMLLC